MARMRITRKHGNGQQPIPKSPALKSLHEVMKDLAIDNAKMAEFDRRCLTPKGDKPSV